MEREMVRLLQKCKSINHLKQTHLRILINGFKDNNFLLQNLITLSSDLISLDYAFKILQSSNSSEVIVYNTMIKCFMGEKRKSSTHNAMNAYKKIKRREFLVLKPNSFTFTFLVRCFDDVFDVGRMIHGEILKMGFDVSSLFVQNTLLNFYGKHGVEFAYKVFDEMPKRDVVSWNTMIGIYMDCGQVESAVSLFESMPAEKTIVTWNSVITGLAKNGKMEFARRVFDKMPERNQVSWNCLISGYVKTGDLVNAENVFNEMPVKSVVTCTAIISGYASSGDIESARKLFDQMGNKRNLVTWNAMIAGYVNQSLFDKALSLFRLMLSDVKFRPDQITLISVLSACSHLCSLENGKWISSYINKNRMNLSTPLGNALIDMFAKCGDIESSKAVFNQMSNRCLITWTTMVSGLAINGMCKEALALFNKMCDYNNNNNNNNGTKKPDGVMFIAVLTACNHGGLVKEGKILFQKMVNDFGIQPQIEHYGCMIDLLARSGELNEAVRMTENMHLVPNAVIWATLISGCKIYGNDKLFNYVTKKVLDQEPLNPSYLTLVTNLSSSIGKWQESLKFRRVMRQEGIEKVPGCSLIEIRDIVHEFVARDTNHVDRSDIYEILESLNAHLLLEC